MVPALAVGFDDVKKRVDAQDNQAAMHYTKLQEITVTLQSKRAASSRLASSRLSKAEAQHATLATRLTRLVSRLHTLTPLRGTPLRAEEEQLHTQIERLYLDLNGKRPSASADGVAALPSGDGGRLGAKLNELWVLAARRKAAKASGQMDGDGQPTEWAVASDEELGRVMEVGVALA